MVGFVAALIPVVVGGAVVIGLGIAKQENIKANASEAAKERAAAEQLVSRSRELTGKVTGHEAKGEYAQAIMAFREMVAISKEYGKLPAAQVKALDEHLQTMIFASQEKAQTLTRDFKVEQEDLQHGDPSKRYVAERDYIENLKVLLPEDDAFLHRTVSRFKSKYTDAINN